MTSASKKILIVDDEEDLTWSISRNLRKENEQYEIICVNSGDEALKFLKRISFDLLISDIRMPGKDGFTLISYAKKHYPDIKVIIMSAWYGPEIKDIVERVSDIFYVEKPFEIHHLKSLIYQTFHKLPDKYRGRLIDFSLKDIIRFNCKNKFNGSLNISNGKESGVIHFRAGEVIHAQVGELEGETAFLDVLNWNNFDYDTVLTDKPIKKTIDNGWKMLLDKNYEQDNLSYKGAL
jgi:CheY-like chemotaxis protein